MMAATNQSHRSALSLILMGMIALAWLYLWVDQFATEPSLHVHSIGNENHHAQLSEWLRPIAFISSWLLMTVAMMLPTIFPLTTSFRRLVENRRWQGILTTSLIAGYLSTWVAFGVVVLFLFTLIATFGTQPLSTHQWTLSAALFLAAGAYQFSPLKYACLDACRSPLAFISQHWRGRNEYRESFRIGWRHGLFCIGCCWALMLLMFAMTTRSVAWMLILSLVMVAEKTSRWGRRLAPVFGVAALAVGVGIAAYHVLV